MRTNPLTIVVPFYEGAAHLPKLLGTLPRDVPVIIADDQSPSPVPSLSRYRQAKVVRTRERGYFAGAVNRALEVVPPNHDVLILNQDVWFTSADWLPAMNRALEGAGIVGDFVRPNKCHAVGYVQGTFMAIRADVRKVLGPLNAREYPHWGVTCLYQLRACRAGFGAAKLKNLSKWMQHARGRARYGSATRKTLATAAPKLARRLIVTPPLVTVVVPVYNKAPYLGEALGSLFASTFQDFEVVVVDDGSTDESRAEIEKWVSPWTYVRAVFLETNQGVPAARNAGVKAAFGPLIFQLDGDDKVDPDGLGRMVAAYARNPARWVYSDLACFGERHNWQVFPDFDDPHPFAIAVRNVAPSCILYPRAWWAQVGGYHPKTARGHDDWGFGIQLTLAGHCGQRLQTVDGDPRPAVFYRKTQGSRNATSRRRHMELQDTRKKLWPGIFKGYAKRRDPVACCGGSRKPRRVIPRQLEGQDMPGKQAYVIYTGGAIASFPVKGAVTGTRYIVKPGEPTRIHAADLRQIVSRRDFQAYKPPKPYAPPPQPLSEAAAQAVMAEAMETAEDEPDDEILVQEEEMDVDEEAIPEVDTTLVQEGDAETVPDPGEMTVADAIAVASKMTLRQLMALESREREGKARVTLLDAIDGYKAMREADAVPDQGEAVGV